MTTRRIRVSILFLAVILVLGFTAAGWAASFPTRAITVVTSSTAGGSTDLSIRMLAKKMTENLGQPVIVENKVGGGGFIAGSAIATAKPDGYYVGIFFTSNFTMAPFLRKPPYDIFKLTPIMSYGMYPFEFSVKEDSPWKAFKDFIEYAKAHPNQATVTTSKPDSMENLPIWMLEDKFGMKVKLVPSEAGPAVAAVLGGHAMAFTGVGTSIPFIREGKMRGLATYLSQRIPTLPDIPTLKEMGYDIVVESRISIYGPPGVPKEVAKTLEDAFRKAMDDSDFQKICGNFGIIPSFLGGAETDKSHRELAAKTKPILVKLGMVKE
jgi:tripartite-type tricarboxylate transporter receptor subunit TctC